MDDQPITSMPTMDAQQSNQSFLSKYKFTIISLVIIIVALIPLVIISKNTKKAPQAPITQHVMTTPTPTAAPITVQNAQPTLSAADQKIQDALTTSNQDLNQVNQIDTSQDSVAGL